MQVAVQLDFKINRKEPLGDLVRRVAALFASSRLEPRIQASFSDGLPVGLRKTSAVERALKKYPHLAGLDRADAPRVTPNLPPIRRLSNADSDASFPLDAPDPSSTLDLDPLKVDKLTLSRGAGH